MAFHGLEDACSKASTRIARKSCLWRVGRWVPVLWTGRDKPAQSLVERVNFLQTPFQRGGVLARSQCEKGRFEPGFEVNLLQSAW